MFKKVFIMNVVQNKKICIECGIEDDIPKYSSHIFFPVFKVQFIQTTWKPPIQKDFLICFTSKHAIYAFKLNILPFFYNEFAWAQCLSVCSVGQKTAELAKKELPSFLYVNSNLEIYPKDANGLKPLLEQLKMDLKIDSQIIIFTSLGGKTSQIVSEIKLQNNFNYEVVPLYSLQNIDDNNSIQFFNSLFQKVKNVETNFVFYCRSGQILNNVLNKLMTFFNVTNPVNLPPFIFFSPWEKSAHHVLLELNLIDRVIS
jgi:hypothetical protein